MSQTEVRLLTERDAESLWAIRLEALELEAQAFSQSASEHRVTSAAGMAPYIQANANQFGIGAFVEGKLVGTLRFVRSEREKQRHRGSVHAMYVSKPHRGKGLGRSMMNELLRLAHEQDGLEQLELHVATEQMAARNLYESCGFSYCGQQERALKIDHAYVDYEIMMLKLR